MTKRTVDEIKKEIEMTKEELENVSGTETEVYSRIVGYYRAVKNWNKGKREEFNNRKLFEVENRKSYNLTVADSPCECSAIEKINATVPTNEKTPTNKYAHYEIFIKDTCPNCPPVKDFMKNINLQGEKIDVGTESGIKIAASKGVFSSPTVIFYDNNNKEITRAHNVDELSEIFDEGKVA